MADVLAAPLQVERVDGRTLVVHCSGDWVVRRGMPSVRDVLPREIDGRMAALPALERVTIHGASLRHWDSSLVSFVAGLEGYCRSNHVAFDKGDLPTGIRRLVDLALAVPEKTGTRRAAAPKSLLITVGEATLLSRKRFLDGLGFLGEATLSLTRLVTGQARFRRSDLLQTVQECGVQALGIAFIISLLVGLILAFVGAVQLRSFGAEIYVANLVVVAMTREMAAIMTAIVLAGRTGAAFAAQIGSMQANEEVDALTTLGIPAMDFLVLPRMLALMLMMPLLYLYSAFAGIFGGFLVGVGMLDLTPTIYLAQTQAGFTFNDFFVGWGKSVLFGALVAIAGCMHGMQSGRSAAAVGNAATAAVVTALVWIIISDAVLAVLLNIVGV
ncbi:MAG: MlaE family ABC transporter permease [Alphaproteobacteria bacterium]